jgi:hypothetical protein
MLTSKTSLLAIIISSIALSTTCLGGPANEYRLPIYITAKADQFTLPDIRINLDDSIASVGLDQITVTIAGQVSVDGTTCPTGEVALVRPGGRKVTITSPGFQPFTRQISVSTSGAPTEFAFTLTPEFATLARWRDASAPFASIRDGQSIPPAQLKKLITQARFLRQSGVTIDYPPAVNSIYDPYLLGHQRTPRANSTRAE